LRLGFGGNKFKHGYSSWDEAQANCSGYDAQSITDTVVSASRAVRDGKAAYERDGVLFDKIEYSWPLLAALMGTPRKGNELRVLDWGGSLGSTYRQNKELFFLAGLDVQWTVIEQSHFVEIGLKEFQTKELTFVANADDFSGKGFDVVLFASSICYLENPSVAIQQAVGLNPSRLIFDRTPESKSKKDLIGVQKVGSGIFKASFPVRSFASGSLQKMIGAKYSPVADWVSDLQPDPQTVAKGYVFQKN
jgi:putative methyltransferase (TIGR04325 family)